MKTKTVQHEKNGAGKPGVWFVEAPRRGSLSYNNKMIVIGFACALAMMSTSVVNAGEFKTGFARVDITPPLGTYMPGYYQNRRATEVLDPLQINMVAFSDGQETALVAQIDTMALSDCTADLMRDAIVKATGVKRDAILLHASHTHDGGQLAYTLPRGSNAKSGDEQWTDKFNATDKLYLEMSVSRVADAAVNAIRDLKPAKLAIGRSRAERISFGRRYLMKSGKVQTNPGTNNPDIVKPVGTADDEVQVVRIDREGGKTIAIINFQTHPDVVGGTTISADWPGLTRTVFEAATFGGAHCIVLNGTQGDVNHCNVLPKPGELNGLKRDFDAVDRGYDHAKHMANVLAAAALKVWYKCEAVEAGAVKCAVSEVKVPAQKGDADPKKDLAWAKDVWGLHEKSVKDGVVATAKDYVTVKYGWDGMELTTEVARAGRIIRMSDHDDFHYLPLWGVSIGKSISFGAFPGEPFNDIGVVLKKKTPFRMSLFTCLTNGSRGYFPFSDSYKQGGYESATSPFGPSVADDLIAGQLKIQNQLY